MLIREMFISDWDDVRAIYEEGIMGGGSTFTREAPDYDNWDKSHMQSCRLVAEDNSRVVGWAVLRNISNVPAYAGVAEVSIYITEKYRRKGVGHMLMEELEIEARNAGVWMLQSTVIARNVASRALHLSHGFREVGYREKIARDKFGIWRDTILYEKRF